MKPKRRDLDLSGGWEYRVLKDGPLYHIIEVFYDSNGKIILWSDSETPSGATDKELKQDLVLMLKAVNQKTLEVKSGKLITRNKILARKRFIKNSRG